jgi:uncharacterized iron-regulated membrane protein
MVARSSKKQLRNAWLQVHKWIGLTLAVLIIPICLTGAALVWHDWLEAKLEPQRHAQYGAIALPPSAYIASAKTVIVPGERISAIRFEEESRPVMVTAVKTAKGEGRPQRTNVWLNPVDGEVIDQANASSGAVQVMHVLHGSLMVPGGWGRPLVGWVGAFMFVSCLTGIWLWWPLSGSVTSGLRWKRRNTTNANLHYMMGFWVLLPLAMLSFTGAWISFPKVFSKFEQSAGPAPDRARAQRALPLEKTSLTVDAAIAGAQPHATGRLTALTLPTDQKAEWKVSFERDGGAPAEVSVDDESGKVTPPKPPKPETLARTMRRWHDGTGMGPGWQVAIFLGGLIPALLSVTGIIIWWRSRGSRARSEAYRRDKAALQPAE